MPTTTHFFEELGKLVASVEIFLHEAPANNYQPAPPKGFIALRSGKRRIFVPNDGKSTQDHLDTKNFTETPLT